MYLPHFISVVIENKKKRKKKALNVEGNYLYALYKDI